MSSEQMPTKVIENNQRVRRRPRPRRGASFRGPTRLSELQRFHNKRQSWPLSEATAELHKSLLTRIPTPTQEESDGLENSVKESVKTAEASPASEKSKKKQKRFNYHKMAAVPRKHKAKLLFSPGNEDTQHKPCQPLKFDHNSASKTTSVSNNVARPSAETAVSGENVETSPLPPLKDRISCFKSQSSSKGYVDHLLPKLPTTSGCISKGKQEQENNRQSTPSPINHNETKAKTETESCVDQSSIPSLSERIQSYSQNLASDYEFEKPPPSATLGSIAPTFETETPSDKQDNAEISKKIPSLKQRIGNYTQSLEMDSATIAPSSERIASSTNILTAPINTINVEQEAEEVWQESVPSIQQRIGNYKENLAADCAPIAPSYQKENSVCTEEAGEENDVPIPSIKQRIGNYRQNLASDSAPTESRTSERLVCKSDTSDSAEVEEVQIPSIQQRIGSYKDNLAADSAPIPPSSDRIAASGQIKHICDKDTGIDNSATSPEPEVKLKQRICKYKRSTVAETEPIPDTI